MTFALILTALNLGLPVRCYSEPIGPVAYYHPAGWDSEPAYIALSPAACAEVRRASYRGAFILAHELAHRWQDVFGRPFDEAEADRIGNAAAGRWQRRLARLFGVRIEPVVRLAP